MDIAEPLAAKASDPNVIMAAVKTDNKTYIRLRLLIFLSLNLAHLYTLSIEQE